MSLTQAKKKNFTEKLAYFYDNSMYILSRFFPQNKYINGAFLKLFSLQLAPAAS